MKLTNRRLPGKNTRPFTNGRPLCQYILDTLRTVREIDEIYVYCSDPRIQDYLPDGVRFLKRSEELDSDSTKINEVLSSFAKSVPADVYLLTHATSPFISGKSISEGISHVISGKYDSSFSATKTQEFMWKNGSPMNYSLEDIPRTQDLELVHVETSGFYCYTYDLITVRNRRIGDRPKIIEVSKIESVDIDELEDFEIADALFNHLLREETGSK